MSSVAYSSDDGETLQSKISKIRKDHRASKEVTSSVNPSSCRIKKTAIKPRRVKERANRPKVPDNENSGFQYFELFNENSEVPRFWNEESYTRFDKISKRVILSERKINFDKNLAVKKAIGDLLEAVSLYKTVTYPDSFFPEVVKEFFANLNPCMFVKEDESFGKFFLRGWTLDFSPTVINSFLETPTVPYTPLDDSVNFSMERVSLAITGKENQFKSNHFKASALTLSAAVLHKIVVFNWLPTKNHTKVSQEIALFLYKILSKIPVNFGEHVFSVIQSCSNIKANTVVLPFPSLICSILLAQVEPVPPAPFSAILLASERSILCDSAISLSSKLLREGHINDIPGTRKSEGEENK